ncbi:FAD/NAD(P)-binding domain-containing protein [Suillus bovinus]|uniref:FAD/NAD(P)-binding domain-containing protein n=1 Tax=Suillus bovinus TaxID=48563 RepID=UPI001B886BDC|nr:FAD/NAD(P)-binding domain-containing protein [Suillus bovinus]KAG2152550.1 FAD/NAD(P)-binding domain-containing protein [Suillus bovinus]
MASEDLHAISTVWLKSLEAASSTGDFTSFVGHFLSDGWLRDLLCFSWNFRSLSGLDKIHRFLSEVVDGKPRFEHSGLRNFKLEDCTANAPSPFKLPGSQGIEGVQGAFTFTITKPAALGRGFFRLTQDADGKWKALTLFTNMQDLIGHEESSADQHGLYEGRKITWEEDVEAKFRAIEADPTILNRTKVGGGQSGLMSAARLGRLGIRALVIEKNARVGDSWRQRTTFPKYIPKGKLAHFIDSYAVDQELCVWLSSSIASTPVYSPSSARWTVEVQHGDRKVIIHPKHLVLATGYGSPRIPTWNGMEEFQGALYHSDFHRDAEQSRGKRVVIVGAGNASSDICEDFVAHGATEVTMVQRSATCVMSSTTAEKTYLNVPFPDGTPVEELDFRSNSMPKAFFMQLKISGGTEYSKMLDKELHDGLRKAGFNLTWELSPGSGEVGLEGFVLDRQASGTMLDIGCGKLIIEGRVKIKRGQDISHFEKDGITFKDGSKLSADVIVLATGNEPIMKTTRSLLGNEITDRLPSKVWGLDSEGELNQTYRPSGHPGLWFAVGSFQMSRFYSKHLGLQILARELDIV